mgnify:CR=1 FL=1
MRVRVYAVLLTSLAILAALPASADATSTKVSIAPTVHPNNWPNCC